MMLDVTKGDRQRRLLEIELEAVGIRLNCSRPDIVFKQKVRGLPQLYHSLSSDNSFMISRLLEVSR